jgi:hypothetical protein
MIPSGRGEWDWRTPLSGLLLQLLFWGIVEIIPYHHQADPNFVVAISLLAFGVLGNIIWYSLSSTRQFLKKVGVREEEREAMLRVLQEDGRRFGRRYV